MSVESIARVLNHSRSVGNARLVLVGIANHDGDGGSWPSIETLARYANVSERTVQRCIQQLAEMGEVVVHANDGGTHRTRADRRPNRYTLHIPDDGEGRGDTGVAPCPDGVTPGGGRGDTGVVDGVTLLSPEPSLNHPQPSKDTSSAKPTASDDVAGFDRFWAAYPRRVGKATARKAWLKATTRADVETIVAGATRMAADPNLPAERFVPHPSTWLNRDGWEDAPYPAQAAGPANTTERVSQAMQVARRMAEAEGQPFPDNVRAIGGGR